MRWKKLLRVGLSFSCRKIRSRKQLVNPVSFDHDGASPLRKRKAVGAESKNTVDTVKVTCYHASHWLQETATRYVASSTVCMSRCQQGQTGRHQVALEGHRQPGGYTRSWLVGLTGLLGTCLKWWDLIQPCWVIDHYWQLQNQNQRWRRHESSNISELFQETAFPLNDSGSMKWLSGSERLATAELGKRVENISECTQSVFLEPSTAVELRSLQCFTCQTLWLSQLLGYCSFHYHHQDYTRSLWRLWLDTSCSVMQHPNRMTEQNNSSESSHWKQLLTSAEMKKTDHDGSN